MAWMHAASMRTNNPNDAQPHQMTNEQFWDHLVKVYREAYPDAHRPTFEFLSKVLKHKRYVFRLRLRE